MTNSARRREQLKRSSARQYDRIRAARGLPPLIRTSLDATFCRGCPWAQVRCTRPKGPCSYNPTGPNQDCLTRYVRADGSPQRCPFYRTPCRMRVCDCPYWPHQSWVCQHCGQETPHTRFAFAQNRAGSLREVRKRSYGPTRPSLQLCRDCLQMLQNLDPQESPIQFLADNLWREPRLSDEERKKRHREYMREYMRKRRSRDKEISHA